MANVGTAENPLRVAVVGSGPAAFYAVEHLFKQPGLTTEIDMFDRLPTPYGLVRGGVAPDHQKIKTVTKVFERIASNPNFRFYGNVEFGKDVSLEDLKTHYHAIIYATGAQTDRRMGIRGEDLPGSFPATEFVAWYNGHPDFRNCQFDLDQERAAVVGVGNVAIDVARILCLSPNELAKTDVADYALQALSKSKIRQVYLLGRRGPAQAAFTNPEVKELGELETTDVIVRPDEVELDPLSRAALEKNPDPATVKKVEILQEYAQRKPTGKPKQLFMRFLVSPVELSGNGERHVAIMRLVRNVLQESSPGALTAKPTDQFEELPVGLVFRSVGYRGVPLPGVPFDEKRGIILNQMGRVLDPQNHLPLVGQYVTGWIKRGPSGVIGTNKPDSVETANALVQDLSQGNVLQPSEPSPASMEQLVRRRQPDCYSFSDWLKLDKLEVAKGQSQSRPRCKFTSVEEMDTALGRR